MSLPTFLSPVVVRRFSTNPNGRDLIVGDLHGCVSKFRARLDEVGFDPARDRVFALGDLIDRGPGRVCRARSGPVGTHPR